MDWKNIIVELQATGMSQVEIGKAVGRSQPWIADIVRGRTGELKWVDGERLRLLHAERCNVPGEPAVSGSAACYRAVDRLSEDRRAYRRRKQDITIAVLAAEQLDLALDEKGS